MSIQTELTALLAPLVAGRIYPLTAPERPLTPYITYFRLFAQEGVTLEKNGGTGNEVHTRLQTDIWAQTYAGAQAKAEEVKMRLKGWHITNCVQGEQDFFDEEARLFRVLLDLSLWHH